MGGVGNLFPFSHCPTEILWKCPIWNISIQHENNWLITTSSFFLVDAKQKVQHVISYPICIVVLKEIVVIIKNNKKKLLAGANICLYLPPLTLTSKLIILDYRDPDTNNN